MPHTRTTQTVSPASMHDDKTTQDAVVKFRHTGPGCDGEGFLEDQVNDFNTPSRGWDLLAAHPEDR
jgi:hypothetical protein